MIKEIFLNFSWKILVTLVQYLFGRFSSGKATQSGSRKMNKIFVHYPMPFSTNIQTHLKMRKWKRMVFCYQNCPDLLWEKIVLKLIISNSTLIIRTPSHCHKFPQALSHFVGSSPSWGDLIFWNLILNGLFHIFLYIRKSFNKPQMSRQLQNS